jgi:sterol desaturase/sphingolipid hydroxylase (fatty acid hydroxylase superfamily)
MVLKSVSTFPLAIFLVTLAAATLEGIALSVRRANYDWKAYLAALASVAARRGARALTVALSSAPLQYAWEHRIFDLRLDPPSAAVILFLGAEFLYYWFHRISHQVRWLWATHAVHHAPNDLNLSVAYQLGWTGPLSGATLFLVPLAWFGFTPATVVAVLALNLFYQFWIHVRWIPKLGPLEWFLNTPSHHRVHHACNDEYLQGRAGVNFGGVLIVFDRMFGTFAEERSDIPCRYGLVKPLFSYNPLYIALHEWIALWRDVSAATGWRQRVMHLFGPPGWKPRI